LQEQALPRGGKANGSIATACEEVPKSPSSRRTSPKVLAGTDGNRTRITLAREQVSIGPNMHRSPVRRMAGINCCWGQLAMLVKNLLHLLTTSHDAKRPYFVRRSAFGLSASGSGFAIGMLTIAD
jgi:hypothetical protein